MGRVLLTGASGHLGRVVLRRLLDAGTEFVVAQVNSEESREILSRLFAGRRVEIVRCSLEKDDLRWVKGYSWEAIIHTAALIPPSGDESAFYTRLYAANILGTARLLSVVGRMTSRCVLVSTVEVYSRASDGNPILEKSTTVPSSFYGVTKLASEEIARLWARDTGIPLFVLRSASIYGPGEVQSRALPSFIRCAIADKAIFLNGMGMARRNYVYVGDAADAVMRSVEGGFSGTANLAGRQIFSMNELASIAVSVAGSHSPVFKLPGHALDLVLDTRFAEDKFGIVCNTSIAEGVSRQVSWLKASANATVDYSEFV